MLTTTEPICLARCRLGDEAGTRLAHVLITDEKVAVGLLG
jgi:hypothetical protein